ncbi:MAG: DUF447 domain-containing protein [Candidatus Hermodarchaeota archaeon]
MTFNLKGFGLKKDNLYEIIATSYSIYDEGSAIKPNASCMGIRVIEGDQIQMSPFYRTTTYKNLKQNNQIAINFVDDIYLYALAALKEKDSPVRLYDFPSDYYDYKHLEFLSIDIPFIKKAWGILIGEVSKEFQKSKNDDLGEFILPVFNLKIIFTEKLKESHKLYNRAENLALESIILATRLRVAYDNKDINLISKICEKISDNSKNVERFGRNKNALKAIELVNQYAGHFS